MKKIIEMAHEAGFAFEEQDNLFVVDPDGVCKFAALARADEREATAKFFDGKVGQADLRDIAAAIRARGNV